MTQYSPSLDNPAPRALPPSRYHVVVRTLHWAMAIGFLLMWATGVFVTNIEGEPFWIENDRQGVVRDLHKSIGLTLLALLAARMLACLAFAPPPLPPQLTHAQARAAHAGHVGLYAAIVAACVTGYAIADVHEYGNAYFGIDLPQIFPTTEAIAGWSSTPWVYVLHAAVAYGLMALVLGHIAFVIVHKRRHGADLLPRMTGAGGSGWMLNALSGFAILTAAVIVVFAARGFVVMGPQEEPRDYIGTTPFGRT